MSISNAVIWRTLTRMLTEKQVTDATITRECDVDVAGLRATSGTSPEIMATDLHSILQVAHVTWTDFVKYFPKKYGLR